MEVSITPDPKNNKNGKSKLLLKSLDFEFDLMEARYTAIRAIMMPMIFCEPIPSLYAYIPKITGSITLILLATEATDKPLRCDVSAIKLKTEINKTPKTKAP